MELTYSPLDALIPIIIALFKQSGLPSKWNALIAIGIYAVWTAVSLTLNLRSSSEALTIETFIPAFVSACVIGFTAYTMFWSHFGEEALETKTSIIKGPVSDPIPAEEGDVEGGNG